MPAPSRTNKQSALPVGENLMRASFLYPEKSAEELGLTDYFRANTNVAGMAWGGGQNGSPKDEPRSIVVNPFNPNMANPQSRRGLLLLEEARHHMDEQGYVPKFQITPMQQEWRKNLGAYATNDVALKQSLISRLLVNSSEVPADVTDEQRKAAQEVMQQIAKRKAIK